MLKRLEPDQCDWERMDAFDDRVLFQTREWLEFVARTQGAEPVVAEVLAGAGVVGYFTGAIIRRFGIPILGSPAPGWTTESMGFNLMPEISRRAAAQALLRFAFGPLRCLHLELKDRQLAPGALAGLGFVQEPGILLEVDLAPDEDAIFARMTSACRRAVRRGEKVGVTVQEAGGEDFADEYYAQLEEVFARQSLSPTYGVERVRELIRRLHPTGRLLLLRAVGPKGEPMATGVFPAMNGTAYFWGGASWRRHQVLRPNEALFWYAMRYWRARGMKRMDLGGGGVYKRRYGPAEHNIASFRISRVAGLGKLRELARHGASVRQRLRRHSRFDGAAGGG